MTDAISSTGLGGVNGVGKARLAESFDTFLALLTAQLKNQDPLSPLDSNQFTQQIVQMTGVEQQLLTNDLLEQLVANTSSGVATAVSLIGKEVRADTSLAILKEGEAEWTYQLDRDAADLKLEIVDANGRVVQTIAPTDRKAGEHTLTWDGKNAAGVDQPDGAYALRITAKDSEGETVPAGAFVDGIVTAVEQANGQTLITINGVPVPWERIISIRQPPEPTDSAEGDPTNQTDDETSPPAAA